MAASISLIENVFPAATFVEALSFIVTPSPATRVITPAPVVRLNVILEPPKVPVNVDFNVSVRSPDALYRIYFPTSVDKTSLGDEEFMFTSHCKHDKMSLYEKKCKDNWMRALWNYCCSASQEKGIPR